MLYPWLMPIIENVSERITQDNLHHGILFVSEPGSGIEVLCKTVAKRLLCTSDEVLPCGSCKACLLYDAQSHPDYHPVTTEKTQIGVDAVRKAIEQVNQTAQLSSNKVVMIENIETMSESASNALLKTLEEPTNNTYLVLTTNAPQYIMATIKSRCEKIRVPMPSYEQSRAYLADEGARVASAEELAAYRHSPLIYKEQSTGDTMNFNDFQEDFAELSDGTKSAESIANKWKDRAEEAVNWVSQLSLQRFSNTVKTTTDNRDTVVGTDWVQVYDKATEAGKQLRQAGLNRVLILSSLFACVASVACVTNVEDSPKT